MSQYFSVINFVCKNIFSFVLLYTFHFTKLIFIFSASEPRDGLVFTSSEGERALYTRDMTVMDDYVIQFEVCLNFFGIIPFEIF